VAAAACVPTYTETAGGDGPDGGGDASADATQPPVLGPPDARADTGGGDAGDAGAADATPEAGGPACPSAKGGPMVRFAVAGGGAFCIDRHEVTQGDFNAYLGDTSAVFDVPPVCNAEKLGKVPRPQPVSGQDALPVGNITFCDAWAYCKWAGKRLCSAIGGPDAGHATDLDDITNEWDYACRNGTKATAYPYGNSYQGGTCNVLDHDAGVNGAVTAPGAYPACHGVDPGFDQLFDMSGNIAEMDDWATSYADQGDASAATTVHTRGGAFDYFLKACTDRFPHPIFNVYSDVGFRCCADAP
jgi:formylglycine-generating enzyme required for sulfatase activity